MADLLGVSREMYNKIENGKYAISRTIHFAFERLKNSEDPSHTENSSDINSHSEGVKSTFIKNKKAYESAGYSNVIPKLTQDQNNSILMANAASSYASLEMLCRLVAHTEGVPIEEVRKQANQLTHDRMKTLEQVLELLVSFP